MYKDPVKQKEANRLANKKYRQKGITETGYHGKGITRYPALITALADPIKRDKIERILTALKRHSSINLSNIWYGIYGPTFKSIDNLLKG